MNGTVILTVFLMVASGELKRYVTKATTPVFRPILAGFIVGIGLFIAAAINPPIAQKICYLLIAFALIVNGAGITTALASSKLGTGASATPNQGGATRNTAPVGGPNGEVQRTT